MKIETKIYKFTTRVDYSDHLAQVVETSIDGIIKGYTEFFVRPNGDLYMGSHYNEIPNHINFSAAYEVEKQIANI